MSKLKVKHFVLNPKSKSKSDPYAIASRNAMKCYAECIRLDNPKLASDLNYRVSAEISLMENLIE